jgi:NADH-quinone oxidoreductase subunit J
MRGGCGRSRVAVEGEFVSVIAFYILATVVILAALGVIGSRNPVHSVLFLIMAFFTSAGLLVLIGAEFLAMLLVVVYVGAVAVLFLFVVMMLDVDFVELKQGFLNYLPFAGLVGAALLAQILLVGMATSGTGPDGFDPKPDAPTNAEAIGAVLYTDNLLLFQLCGLILLVAMIGAIVLTLRERPGVRRQSVAQQTGRRREEAFTSVDVEPGKGI